MICVYIYICRLRGRRERVYVHTHVSDMRLHVYLQAAGSERAGIRTHGEPCMGEEQVSTISGNRAHSCMFGLMMQPGDEIYSPCYQIAGKVLTIS